MSNILFAFSYTKDIKADSTGEKAKPVEDPKVEPPKEGQSLQPDSKPTVEDDEPDTSEVDETDQISKGTH